MLERLRKTLAATPACSPTAIQHAVREIAKEKSLRDDLADLVLPFKPMLPEFAFLWKEDDEDKPEARHLTAREIMCRILSRMKSKALIGECHGPADKITKGFPDHDKGRAKEALDLLIKVGVVRHKGQQGGRVSIEPKWVQGAERFVAGETLGAKAVDDWCEAK
jgi:hypothetical protein